MVRGGRGHFAGRIDGKGRGSQNGRKNKNNRGIPAIGIKRFDNGYIHAYGGISRVDESQAFCRPSRESSTDAIPSIDDTDTALLSYGLSLVGFGPERQNVTFDMNVKRFKAFYGPGPRTLRALLSDLEEEFESIVCKDVLMTLNWFKLYESQHVLSGRWGYCEKTVEKKIKENAKKIQAQLSKKIRFEGFDPKEIYWFSVDCVHFRVNEFRLDPSTKWYDNKSHSAGLTYEFAVALRRSCIVWVNGTKQASKHDMNVFRGGKASEEEKWDKKALYFLVPPGKRGIGDSGYAGEPDKLTVTRGEHSREFKKFLGRAKNRQESMHTRLTSFGVLSQRFRHGKGTKDKMEFHQMCCEAVCVIVQYDLENGHTLFEI